MYNQSQKIIPSEELKKEIWARAKPVHGEDPNVIREDKNGFWIVFDQFRTDEKYAWDIIEIKKDVDPNHPERELIPHATLPVRIPTLKGDIAESLLNTLGDIARHL